MKKKIIKLKPLCIYKSVDGLFNSVALLINQCQHRVAATVNEELVHLFWNIGKLIRQNILQNKRAGYGEQIIQILSEKLIQQFGSGWSKRQLWNCVRSADIFTDDDIVHALRSQLSWTHIRVLILLTLTAVHNLIN
jgi:hypothetical protein